MSQVPATIIPDITNLCNRLCQKAEPPSPFDLARLDDMLKKIGRVDKAAELCFRGVYYALAGNLDKSIEFHERSIKEFPEQSAMLYDNYTASMERLGELDRAIDAALTHISLAGASGASLESLLAYAYYTGRRDIITQWLPKFHSLTGRPHEIEELMRLDNGDEEDLSVQEMATAAINSGSFSDILDDVEDNSWHTR